MDLLSVGGIVLGLVAILGGAVAKGGTLGGLWNVAAFLIVMVGTLGATMVHSRMAAFLHAFRILPWIFRPPRIDSRQTIINVVKWSRRARKEGLLALETTAEKEKDLFTRKGFQLLVDGVDPQALREIMEADLDARESFDLLGAKVFETMGIYSPTLGIIGAVMGLMAVMQNLAEPGKLGPGIAAAFVATIYGVALANLLFLPIASKLRSIAQARAHHQSMLLEGLVAIAEGDNPQFIESKLSGFVQG